MGCSICSEVLSSSLQEIIVPDNHGKQKSESKQEEGDVCRSRYSLPTGQMDWKLQPQGTLRGLLGLVRCPWRFSRRAILPSLLLAWLLCSRLCRGPAQHFAQTVNVLEFPFASRHTTTVSPGLTPLFTTSCQGWAVLAEGPTSSPCSAEPLLARSLEILSWWLSGHLSALAFLESNYPLRHLLPDLVLSPLSTPLRLGPLHWTAMCPQASVFSISGMIRPPLPWLILTTVTSQGGNRPSVYGPLSVVLPSAQTSAVSLVAPVHLSVATRPFPLGTSWNWNGCHGACIFVRFFQEISFGVSMGGPTPWRR